jgi:ABC-2 type transport system permease protein
LGAVGLLVFFMVALSWLSAAVGLLTKDPEAANGSTFLWLFLPYASSAFVPIATMPGWIRGFARHQPMTPLIESIRGLLLGTPVGSNWWIALTWCAGILAVALTAATLLFPHPKG